MPRSKACSPSKRRSALIDPPRGRPNIRPELLRLDRGDVHVIDPGMGDRALCFVSIAATSQPAALPGRSQYCTTCLLLAEGIARPRVQRPSPQAEGDA